MKALIVDNEKPVREVLKKLIQSYCPEISEIEEENGVQNGVLKILSYKPDVLFLDVEMDDGTGFDLLNKLSDFPFQLVFITAHDKYALQAFRYAAIDFLLKPIEASDLVKCVQKIKGQLYQNELKNQLEVMRNQLQNGSFAERKIVISDSKSIFYLKPDQILSCEADGAYTKLVLIDGSKITASYSLKEYEDLLEPFGFIRPHHSHLINPNYVLRFDKQNGGMLILKGNIEVPVSSRKKDHILAFLAGKK